MLHMNIACSIIHELKTWSFNIHFVSMRDCGTNSFTHLNFIIIQLWNCGTAGATVLQPFKSNHFFHCRCAGLWEQQFHLSNFHYYLTSGLQEHVKISLSWDINPKLRMYKVLLFKFGRYLCKGPIDELNVNQREFTLNCTIKSFVKSNE